MSTQRMRMIAGPNGSGKTTLMKYLGKGAIPLGFCQNPDDIEAQIRRTGRIDFGGLGLRVSGEMLRDFIGKHPLGDAKWRGWVAVRRNVLTAKPEIGGGYFAAVLSDFIRQEWVKGGDSFTFETVMSGADKVELMARARAVGYRTYLYYICTDSAKLNLARVAVRVADGGHNVPQKKVEERYLRSLKLLPQAIAAANRAYLFDNSGTAHRLIAEYEEGRLQQVSDDLPSWYLRFVLNPRSDR